MAKILDHSQANLTIIAICMTNCPSKTQEQQIYWSSYHIVIRFDLNHQPLLEGFSMIIIGFFKTSIFFLTKIVLYRAICMKLFLNWSNTHIRHPFAKGVDSFGHQWSYFGNNSIFLGAVIHYLVLKKVV